MYELTEWRRATPPSGKYELELVPAVRLPKSDLGKRTKGAYDLMYSKDELRVKFNGGRSEIYSPNDSMGSGPHRTFLDMVKPKDPESVLKFVSKYGFLGLSPVYRFTDPGEHFESVSDILAQRQLLDAFYSGVVSANETLTKIFRKHMGRPPKRQDFELNSGMLNRFNELSPPRVAARLETHDSKGAYNPSIKTGPKDLISWMWLKAADELIGPKFWDACPYCEKTFLRMPTNTKQKTCGSAKCRKRHERATKKGIIL